MREPRHVLLEELGNILDGMVSRPHLQRGEASSVERQDVDNMGVWDTESKHLRCRSRHSCPEATLMVFRVPRSQDRQAEKICPELRSLENQPESLSPVSADVQYSYASLGYHSRMDVGEDLHEHLWRKMPVDGCGIVIRRPESANVGFCLGDGATSARTIQFVKVAVLVLMLLDPRRAPLLNFDRGNLLEYCSILFRKGMLRLKPSGVSIWMLVFIQEG